MAEDSDQSEKTEEPTHKRLDEALKKGQVAHSREVVNFLMLVLLAFNILLFAPYYMRETTFFLSKFLTSPHDIAVNEDSIGSIAIEIITNFLFILSLPVLASVFVALLSSFLQNGIVISGEPLMPKLEKISPIKGLGRLFSLKSVIEFLKGLIKIIAIGVVSYIVVMPELGKIYGIMEHDLSGLIALLVTLSFKIVLGSCIVMFVVAALDYMYQRFEYIKSLKMTRQELKEEYKQSEGDPQIKARLRKIRMERARRRMMAAVPEADVVIRNPTHFAVALKYDEATMKAPQVVALGQDNIALKIIEVAEENDVVIVRNPPLARALFSSSELDQEIPLEHYQAVAEVIGYVYRLKGKTKGKRAA